MKKLFYLFLTLLISVIFISCEKDDIFDIVPTNPDKPNYQSGLVIGRYTSDISSLKSMYNSNIVHSIPFKSTTKSSETTDNYVLIEDINGNIDTLRLSDEGSIKITGIDDFFPINKNYLLFYGNYIDVSYEVLTHEYITVYDSAHIDSTTNYINVVDTTFVNDDMWLVYYDTVDFVIDTSYTVIDYSNILYDLNDGKFYDVGHNINLYNDKITKSFNDPFYKNTDSTKFYFLNNYNKIIEVDLNSDVPNISIVYDSYIYDDNFMDFHMFDDHIIYKSDINQYNYITKNGTYSKLDQTIIWNDTVGTLLPIHFIFVLNDNLYIIIEDNCNSEYDYYKFIHDSVNDSIFIQYDKSIYNDMSDPMSLERELIYEYTHNNNIYFFNKSSKILLSISKDDLTYTNTYLDIDDSVNDYVYAPVELQTKMNKFFDGFIIYRPDNIYLINTNSKSSISATSIASGYTIKTMTTNDDGTVVFYGKNPSGQDIKGVINLDYTITETLVEYDSNGTLITNI